MAGGDPLPQSRVRVLAFLIALLGSNGVPSMLLRSWIDPGYPMSAIGAFRTHAEGKCLFLQTG